MRHNIILLFTEQIFSQFQSHDSYKYREQKKDSNESIRPHLCNVLFSIKSMKLLSTFPVNKLIQLAMNERSSFFRVKGVVI